MKKVGRTKGPRALFRRYWISGAVVLVALLGAAGFLYWRNEVVQAQIDKTNADTQAMIKETDLKIKASNELKAKKAAEEKAAQEAAAKEAAEQSKTAGEAGATTINPKSCNSSTSHNNPAAIDVMVNKKHCIQPLAYAPADLVTSNGATLSAKAIDGYNQMYAAAAAAGQGFGVTSSYRSYNTQISTYNYWVSMSGQAGADTYSARPGYSEHQTGLVMDVSAGGCSLDCFGTTSQYQWLQQNAANYGFIQRYYAGFESVTGYKAEEWHYRYVGVQVAKDMQARGIKTLEQYWNMPGGDY